VGATAGGLAVPRPNKRPPNSVGFLLDENVPRRLARAFRAAGYCCWAVRDVRLGGASDPAVLQYCLQAELVLVSRDRALWTNPAYKNMVKQLPGFVVLASPKAKNRSVKEEFEILARRIRELEQKFMNNQLQFELRARARLVRLT
jgi:predicted nuclease of predicted toxin-antitoxin system